MFCRKCGKEIKDAAKFCPYCGAENLKKEKENFQPDNAKTEESSASEATENKQDTGIKNRKKTGAVILVVFLLLAASIAIAAVLLFNDGGSKEDKKQKNNISKTSEASEVPETAETALGESEKSAEDSGKWSLEAEKTDVFYKEEAVNCRTRHTYEVIMRDCTWEEAWLTASQMGGYLVRFDNAEEFNEVTGQLGSEHLKSKLWIGGKRSPGSNEYLWLTEEGTYQSTVINGGLYAGLWMNNEPSFRDQGIEEEYLNLFYYDKEGRWVLNDVPNNIISMVHSYAGQVGFIVEYENQ